MIEFMISMISQVIYETELSMNTNFDKQYAYLW